MNIMDYRAFSNSALLDRLRELSLRERGGVSDFVACLAEADRRAESILAEGYASLFDLCVRELKLAESTAYQRVKAAALVRVRPEILPLLADGSINLSNLCLIAPRLEEHPALLTQIVGKRKREVEALLASFGVPRDIPDRIRPIPPSTPLRSTVETASVDNAAPPSLLAIPAEAPSAVTRAESRMEFRFAAGSRFIDAVEKLRAMLWHKHPEGRLEDLLFEAANDFILRRDPAREPRTKTKSRGSSQGRRSRRIPADERRRVWRRDAGRCSFSGPAGPCGESRGLEIDHIRPWALGGRSDDASNLRLLCRAHNQGEAARVFGKNGVYPGRLFSELSHGAAIGVPAKRGV
jgi:5-methylcytosine-specific restriction endonuclease McrA